MAGSQYITRFPDHIDRDYFGAWLSGFADGESTFTLGLDKNHGQTRTPNARFVITLRDDDADIVRLIRSFFGVGYLHYRQLSRSGGRNNNPQVTYYIAKAQHLASVIVPHFERFPLLAKKRNDFEIWKLGIALLYRVTQRKGRGRGGPGAGTFPRWASDEIVEFESYRNALRLQRQYSASASVPSGILLPQRKAHHVQQRFPVF